MYVYMYTYMYYCVCDIYISIYILENNGRLHIVVMWINCCVPIWIYLLFFVKLLVMIPLSR